jgi:phospholipid/cholesterol/gamma-HCH transport system substrate-binding protein
LSRRITKAALGGVALALFAGAVAMTWVFLQGGFEGGVPVRAVFSAPGVGQQLPEGGDVKIRGVLVGRIAEISLDDEGNAELLLRLDSDESALPASTTAEIRSKTVFGQKWVELIPPDGAVTGETLAEAGVIPDSQTKEPLELERALQLGHDLLSEIPLDDLAVVFSELADGFEGSEEDAGRAIDRGLVALKAVNAQSADFDLSLRQLREFSDWLADNDQTLLGFMSSLDSANRALVGAAPAFESSLDSVPLFFDRLAAFQEVNEGNLGRLVQSGASLAELLAKHSDDLEDIVVNLQAFTTVWNSGLEQPCGGLYEQNLTCWQVYQVPGLDSRGLYGPGEAPDRNQPSDPNFGKRGTGRLLSDLAAALEAGAPASDLANLLMAPAAGGVAP